MRVHVCASPAGSAIHHTPTNLFILYKYKKLDWGCGCQGMRRAEGQNQSLVKYTANCLMIIRQSSADKVISQNLR